MELVGEAASVIDGEASSIATIPSRATGGKRRFFAIDLNPPNSPRKCTSILLRDRKTILRRQSVATLYGQSESKKTFIALDMALTVAFDKASLAGFECGIEGGGRVCFVSGEGQDEIAKRIAAARVKRGLGELNGRLEVFPQSALVGDGETWKQLAADSLDDNGEYPAFYVIDTLSANSARGIRIDATEGAEAVMDDMRQLSNKTGACVLVIHHAGWAATGKRSHERGGSALRCNTDTSIQALDVTRNHKSKGQVSLAFVTELTCEKQRDADKFPSFLVGLEAVETDRGFLEELRGEILEGSNVSLACVSVDDSAKVQATQDSKGKVLDFASLFEDGEVEVTQEDLAKRIECKSRKSRSTAIRLINKADNCGALLRRKVGNTVFYSLPNQSALAS